MISFAIGQARFNFRAAGVCIDDDYVLLQQFAGADYWCLPGGRVEIEEPTAVAVLREWQEELHETAQLQRLLWVVENFFPANHEIGFYYLLVLPIDSIYGDKTQTYVGKDGETDFILRWFPVDSLPDLLLYPAFLRTCLGMLPTTPEHIVEHE